MERGNRLETRGGGTMESREFKIKTEKYVREALTEFAGSKPSEKNVRRAASKIVKAFQPVVVMDSHKK